MNEEQAKTATMDELRDWLAGDDGWKQEYENKWHNAKETGIDATRYDHPHPPTLDGAAAALSEGWTWRRFRRAWWGCAPEHAGCDDIKVPDTGDEIADRYRLAVLCRLAEKAVEK